ncbi:MAG: TRAP transporter small permease [Deltaproteobacteria bacterium]|nr:MAG: TRAP transporter small permease [Deltaproteobacteria bacterium]
MESFFRFNRGVMLGGKILVGAIMTGATFLLFINVVLRYAFQSGIAWAEEMTRYTLLWTVFVGAGVVTREGTHVSMEAFFNLWPEKLQRIGFLAINLFCVTTIAVILYFGIGIVRMVVETGQTSEAAFVPMWIIYGAIPVGALLMILGYIETAWRQWSGRPLADSDIAFTHGRH